MISSGKVEESILDQVTIFSPGVVTLVEVLENLEIKEAPPVLGSMMAMYGQSEIL